ncbi:MAG: TetR/AcrR family transcriptional regulator [Pseudomonadota bacterium]
MTGITGSLGKTASRGGRTGRGRLAQVNGMDDTPRGKLLSAAARLFRERGFERTTVRDIAALVGIQSGSLFHHFSSKEEILKAVMIDVIRFNTERLRKAVAAAGDTRGKLRALIECELLSIVGDTREAMAVLGYCWDSLSPASQKDVLELRAVYEDIWLSVLRAAQQEGLMQTDAFVMRRLLTGAISWSNTWFDPNGPMSADQLIDTVLGMAIR